MCIARSQHRCICSSRLQMHILAEQVMKTDLISLQPPSHRQNTSACIGLLSSSGVDQRSGRSCAADLCGAGDCSRRCCCGAAVGDYARDGVVACKTKSTSSELETELVRQLIGLLMALL